MLLALVVFVFILGFATAIVSSKPPKNIHTDASRFIINIQSLIHSITTGSSTASDKLEKAFDEIKKEESNIDGFQYLLTKKQVEDRYPEGTWERSAYDEFSKKITNKGPNAKTFPCVYATAGFKANDHRYVFLPTDDPSTPQNIHILGPAMRAYLKEAHHLGPNTSLVVICPESKSTHAIEEYNARFWNFLRGLRIYDSSAWPAEFPSSTGHEQWTMCYAGEALFPIALTPAHKSRLSRQSRNLIIAMQPKWVIDQLLSTPERRKSATDKVRKLLKEYDEIDISPDLTAYGEQGSSESRQLLLRDDNESAEIPFADIEN